MQKNQILTLDILRYGMDAQGVAVHDGMTVFVKDALPGERVSARVERVEKRMAFARAVRVLTGSEHRRASPCPYADRCGGCACMHMAYEEQLVYKHEQVLSLMTRVGGFSVPVNPVFGMGDPLRYRNKAAIPVGGVSGTPEIGFFARRSHRLIPCEDCLIARAETSAAARAVRDFMRMSGLTPYDEDTHTGVMRHVVTRVSRAGECMVILCAACETLPDERGVVDALRRALPKVCSVWLCAHTKPDNVILGGECRLLWGDAFLSDTLCGKTFRLSPQSFFQVNPSQTEVLYAAAIGLCALTGSETVWDLYSGAGTISLALADKAARVIGVESVEAAVLDARQNARRGGTLNAEFIAGEVEAVLPELLRTRGAPHAVVLDPPRKGAHPDALNAIAHAAPERVVYISCNPATQARDLKILAGLGYTLKVLQPVDMFCYTGDVENIALMTRNPSAVHTATPPEPL